MVKTVIKELGIVILLLIAISLVIAIFFYDYIPNNKIVPVKIEAYSIPEDVQQELEEAIPSEQNIVRTYYIDSSDLSLYEATNDYDKGKANPFAYYSTENDSNEATNNGTSSNNINSNNIENSNQNEVYISTPGKNY